MHNLIDASDVFLDGIPCSGRSTTMTALLGGKPVVAIDGNVLRSSFSAGILQTLKLDELIAGSVDDYVAKAVRLGLDQSYREQISQRTLSLPKEASALNLDVVSASLEKALIELGETSLPTAIRATKADKAG